MTKLVVNADDFGQSRGVNAGIVEAHRQGIVTSTTLLANGSAFSDAVALSHSCPNLGVGVHLNFVEGRPVCAPDQVRSLVDRDGHFISKFRLLRRHWTGRLKLAELGREAESQIDRMREAGIVPTHVDAHKNLHAYPPFFETIVAVAQSRGIGGIRIPYERAHWRGWLSSPRGAFRMSLLNVAARVCRSMLSRTPLVAPCAFGGTIRTGALTAPWLIRWLRSLSEPSAELMVHPGRCDDELRRTGSRLLASREAELAALVDPQVRETISQLGIELVHYGELVDSLRQANSALK